MSRSRVVTETGMDPALVDFISTNVRKHLDDVGKSVRDFGREIGYKSDMYRFLSVHKLPHNISEALAKKVKGY